ncbi:MULTISPECIES: Imm44 family immunity protein [unclassified Caballeronia]|uniref:Imm44 family immunity protein n=1 Tax=unclassified Caballeronia TaxID=2646786 RepID=UPI002858CDE2|nr:MULTISPECIES: Imm44 family immunity protein [unclassified Caballeronia]MDR5741433.1 Imm44 family immunity protein [Caballeronia sp. LZ016]MDR5806746.1 Imm44 family immunity protein [Caballeronia sp. LZ019]
MATEADSDVADAFREARKIVEDKINSRLISLSLQNSFEKWAFIAMIRSDKDWANEIAKKNSQKKVLEFRLKIDHERFLNGDLVERQRLLLSALSCSVDKMEKLGISDNDRSLLYSILQC